MMASLVFSSAMGWVVRIPGILRNSVSKTICSSSRARFLAEALVRPETEGHVVPRAALDVELLGPFERRGVAVRRVTQHQHPFPPRGWSARRW